MPNPTIRLDAQLGLVVIEFHDRHGAVRLSFPSQREIAAYKATEMDSQAASSSSNKVTGGQVTPV